MNSEKYDIGIIKYITPETLKDLSAVAVGNYLIALGVINRDQEIVDLKFGESDDPTRLVNGQVPLIINLKRIRDNRDYDMEIITKNGEET